MHQFGWLSERGGNFFNLFQKEGVTQRVGGVCVCGGGPTLEETMEWKSHHQNTVFLELNHALSPRTWLDNWKTNGIVCH